MREASRIVLDGFELGTDAKILRESSDLVTTLWLAGRGVYRLWSER